MRKIAVKNDFLAEAAAALRQGRTVKVRIDGQSMYPFIAGGRDVVEIGPIQTDEKMPAWCCLFYQWEGQYMIHRLIEDRGNECLMMGDGNLARIEHVKRSEILGILRYIHHADGSIQDCRAPQWTQRGALWYRLRHLRRFLLPALRIWDRQQAWLKSTF